MKHCDTVNQVELSKTLSSSMPSLLSKVSIDSARTSVCYFQMLASSRNFFRGEGGGAKSIVTKISIVILIEKITNWVPLSPVEESQNEFVNTIFKTSKNFL